MSSIKKKKKKPYLSIFIGSLKNFLRQLWMRSPIRAERLKLDAVYIRKYKKDGTPYQKDTLTGYTCIFCGGFIDKKIEKPVVHHIAEVGKFDLDNLWVYIQRLLFPDINDIGTAHLECHKKHHSKKK